MFTIFYSIAGIFDLAVKLFEDYFRLVRGAWTLAKVKKPIISVFGGAKLEQDHPYAQQVHNLSDKLLEHGISVITGGGTGIMEAANCGSKVRNPDTSGKSIGILLESLQEQEPPNNNCMDEMIVTRYFFARKWLLTSYSTAFAVFPGGFGTADELFEILTLMQTDKLKRVPIVLVGTEFWKPLVEWVKMSQKNGLLLQEDADLIFVTDDVDKAFNHLHQHCGHNGI